MACCLAYEPCQRCPWCGDIYALLAVLLWPSDRQGQRASFTAARAVGAPIAKGLWFVLWASLWYFAVEGANRSSQGLHDLVYGLASGEPSWLASLDLHAASLVDHKGSVISVALGVLLAAVAVGVYLPAPARNGVLVSAILLSLAFWVIGEDFGTLFTSGGTDVNSGPLLVLLSVAYWDRTTEPGRPPRSAGHLQLGQDLR